MKQVNDKKVKEITTMGETREDGPTFIYSRGVDETQLSPHSDTY